MKFYNFLIILMIYPNLQILDGNTLLIAVETPPPQMTPRSIN